MQKNGAKRTFPILPTKLKTEPAIPLTTPKTVLPILTTPLTSFVVRLNPALNIPGKILSTDIPAPMRVKFFANPPIAVSPLENFDIAAPFKPEKPEEMGSLIFD